MLPNTNNHEVPLYTTFFCAALHKIFFLIFSLFIVRLSNVFQSLHFFSSSFKLFFANKSLYSSIYLTWCALARIHITSCHLNLSSVSWAPPTSYQFILVTSSSSSNLVSSSLRISYNHPILLVPLLLLMGWPFSFTLYTVTFFFLNNICWTRLF